MSIELPELRHGILTYYLIEGLKGAADLNQDGIVTVQELYEYVEAQVSKKSRTAGGNQHPMMKGGDGGDAPPRQGRALAFRESAAVATRRLHARPACLEWETSSRR